MLKKIVLGLVTIVSFVSCNKNCDYNSCAVVAPNSEIQAVQSYLSANGIAATQHCSGLFYVIEQMGSGKKPSACGSVNATYVGKLTNGSVFDQGTVTFGLDEVIKGWTNGLPLIKTGGTIHLYIPPSLGYGSQANGPIPANSILIFDVTLNGVE
jgi:FKBP-type peptidyl-prolyl cis-trans isomerase FkpA